MGKRAAGLAQIQEYLSGASSGDASAPASSPGMLPENIQPHAAPGTTPETQTKEQIQLDQAAANRDRAVLSKEREQLKLEQEQKSALEERTDQAAAKMQQVVNYSKFRLEAIPMPGGLFLPIALLFVFFLALLPIAGHTRLSWLWQVVTGNAALSQEEDLTPFVPTSSPQPTTPTAAPAPTMQPAPGPAFPILPFFTGVEQE